MSKDDTSVHKLRKFVADTFIFVILLACVNTIEHVWTPFKRGFFCGDETLMYPYQNDTVTVVILRCVGLIPPLVCFLICEWVLFRTERSNRCLGITIPCWLSSYYNVAISFGIGTCFIELITDVGKHVIGRLRPFFFEICQPSVDCSLTENHGRYIKPEEYTCTSESPYLGNNIRKSFPSGHSAWISYTLVYLIIYLEKRFIGNSTRTLRHTFQFLLLLTIWFVGLSRITDNRHHWSDVVCGYAIGTTVAILMCVRGTEFTKTNKTNISALSYDVNLSNQELPH